MVLECLDGLFGGVDMVVVGFDKEEIAFVFCEKLSYLATCLIVHHVQSDFVTFAFQKFNFFFFFFKDDVALQVCNGQGQDGICLIVVQNEKNTHYL